MRRESFPQSRFPAAVKEGLHGSVFRSAQSVSVPAADQGKLANEREHLSGRLGIETESARARAANEAATARAGIENRRAETEYAMELSRREAENRTELDRRQQTQSEMKNILDNYERLNRTTGRSQTPPSAVAVPQAPDNTRGYMGDMMPM